MTVGYIADVLRKKDRAASEKIIRDNARYAYLGDHEALCIVLGRYKMYVDTRDVGFTPHMIFDGFWEFWLTQFMAEKIKAGDHVCDIGANLGYYTILMSELVGPEGRVHAFEPNPVVHGLLDKTMALNGFTDRCRTHQRALAEHKDAADLHLFIPKADPKNATLVSTSRSNAHGATVTVKSMHIDEIVATKMDFIKIDVEGAELGVLKSLQGLKNSLSPQIVVEVNFARGYSYDDILALVGYGDELLHIDYWSNVEPLTRKMAETERIRGDWLVYWPGHDPAAGKRR